VFTLLWLFIYNRSDNNKVGRILLESAKLVLKSSIIYSEIQAPSPHHHNHLSSVATASDRANSQPPQHIHPLNATIL
jgi:hypothetical protein